MGRILSHSMVAADGGRPERWLYLLHGIYGSGRNWGSLARRLVEERPEWQVVLVDLRLHGGSTGFEPPHTLERAAEDLVALEDSLGHPADAILGHSFGGKVALVRAAAGPPPAQIWVADSTLRAGEPSGTAWDVIEIVRELPDRIASRDVVVEALAAHGYAKAVGQWLAINLEREGDAFRWRLDWEGIEEMLRDFFRTDVWPTVENPPEGAEVHIIKASQSSAVDDESAERIRRAGAATGRVHLHVVEAGHWLNVDNPDAVLRLLAEHLR
jgi:esterase